MTYLDKIMVNRLQYNNPGWKCVFVVQIKWDNCLSLVSSWAQGLSLLLSQYCRTNSRDIIDPSPEAVMILDTFV